MNEMHSPPNAKLRIDEVYLFVSVDETGEGVCAAPLLGPGSIVPLTAADEARMQSLLPWARHVARTSGKTVRLLKMSTRVEVMELRPEETTEQ